YGLSRAGAHGWSDNLTIATLVAVAALLVLFVAIEAFTRQPLMPLRIFRDRNRSGAYALSLANGATLSGMLFLMTLFLQNILGFSPLRAGLAFLPTAAGVVVGAGLTSRLIVRSGPVCQWRSERCSPLSVSSGCRGSRSAPVTCLKCWDR